MADTKQIYDFAQRYLRIFTEPDPSPAALGNDFAHACYALGFRMDLGEDFMRAYPGDAFYETSAFIKIAGSIEDPYMLGTAIFSRWRLVTHWEEKSVLEDDNRAWFIAALGRLAELTAEHGASESTFKGDLIKAEISTNGASSAKRVSRDEVEQDLTIASDGRVSYRLSRLNADGAGHTFIWNEPAFRIEKDAVKKVFDAILLTFPYVYSDSEDTAVQETPPGTWRMVLTNQWGRPYRTAGELGMEIMVDGENLSDIIREAIGKDDLLLFDGNPDLVNRLELRYRRGVPLPLPENPEKKEGSDAGEEQGKTPRVRWEYKEHVVFDRHTSSVEHALDAGPGHRSKTTVFAHGAVPEFLDEIDPDETFHAPPGNPEDALARPGEITEYQLALFTKYGNTKVYNGSYDAKSVPPQWNEFLDKVLTFLSFYEYGELFDEGRYGRALRRESDYVYALVAIGTENAQQWYLSDDPSVIDGDNVLVPFDGKDQLGQIVQIVYGTKQDSPVTFKALKKVQRKVTSKDVASAVSATETSASAEAAEAKED